MNKKIRWGLLGAGEVVDRWMKGVSQVDDMEVVAVASRTEKTAVNIAAKWNIPKVMNYDEMIHCQDIDIAYIPVPHTAHKQLAISAMNAGKNVLVEKPAALNAKDFVEMIQCAKDNNVFLMEAVWTRFFPVTKKALEYINEDKIGEVRSVQTAFSFRVNDDYKGRLVDINQGGGGLLDTGVYNLHFMQMIYQKSPIKLFGVASMNTDELHIQVDEQASYIGQYDHGELAVMSSGIRTHMIDTAYIYGTKGYIVIPRFWKPTKMQVVIGKHTECFEEEVPHRVEGIEDEGYQYEISYVNECIRTGIKESPYVSFEISHSVLEQCDMLRKEWNLVYSSEK
ncbi:MAG: Gfo/Idh/MocA family protein [Suipraeoptans sp.]